jgi:nucleoside-diphosphate-sugar epimerase
MSFSPKEIHQSLQAHYPNFEIAYQTDFRQQIADSWPNSIDDSVAKKDWQWQPKFDLKAMTETIVNNLPTYFNYNAPK